MTDGAPGPTERPGRLLPGHRLVLLQNGQVFFPALAEAMDAARQSIHLETYIFEFSGAALGVAEALERAARRGVHVRLVIDGVGSPRMPQEWRRRFAAAGVHWHHYAPLGGLGLLIPSSWRRLHRKLCVVDGVVGFCGGINIIDDQDDVVLGRLAVPRLDFSLQVTGPIVGEMTATMERLWWRLQAVRKARQREFVAAWDALKVTLPVGDFSNLWGVFDGGGAPAGTAAAATEPGALRPVAVDDASAALLLRDNISHRGDIERAYLKAIGEARHEVVIANAYFIPGRRLRRALIMAVARGVRVRLLVQGRYERFLQYHSGRPVYARLVREGVDILEYTPSSLHAKVAVIDRRWATVGSTNLDPVSLLLAREANVTTTDRRFAERLHDCLDDILRHSGRPIDAASLAARPWRQRARDRLAFAIMRAVLFVTGHRY